MDETLTRKLNRMRFPNRASTLALTFALALVLLVGCGGDEITGLPALSGSMSAVIDGEQWEAAIALTASTSGGILAFAGSAVGNETIGMALVLGEGAGHSWLGTEPCSSPPCLGRPTA